MQFEKSIASCEVFETDTTRVEADWYYRECTHRDTGENRIFRNIRSAWIIQLVHYIEEFPMLVIFSHENSWLNMKSIIDDWTTRRMISSVISVRWTKARGKYCRSRVCYVPLTFPCQLCIDSSEDEKLIWRDRGNINFCKRTVQPVISTSPPTANWYTHGSEIFFPNPHSFPPGKTKYSTSDGSKIANSASGNFAPRAIIATRRTHAGPRNLSSSRNHDDNNNNNNTSSELHRTDVPADHWTLVSNIHGGSSVCRPILFLKF